MARYRHRRVNQKGRTISADQFAKFDYRMLQSDAWRGLSGSALKIFLELRTRFNGCNNGELALSLDSAAELLGMGKATASRAFEELQQKGFLLKTAPGQWYGRKATLWALTTHSINGAPRTDAWKNWTRPKNKASVPHPNISSL